MAANRRNATKSTGRADDHAAGVARVKGLASAFVATLCWSSSAILVDRLSMLYRLTSLQISTWRIALVLPPLLAFLVWKHRGALGVPAGDLPLYALAGLTIAASNVTWALSVQINRPTVAAALGFSAPAFIALGDRIIFGTRLTPLQISAVTCNLAGCVLAAGVQSPAELVHSPGGLVVGLGNGLSFTAYTLIGRRLGRSHAPDPLLSLFWIFLVGTAGMVLLSIPVEGTKLAGPHLDGIGVILLVAVALGPTLAAYAFYNSSLRVLPASVASLITTLEPPIVAVSAFVLLGRTIHGLQWVGVAVIICAVLAMQLSVLRPRTAVQIVEERELGSS